VRAAAGILKDNKPWTCEEGNRQDEMRPWSGDEALTYTQELSVSAQLQELITVLVVRAPILSNSPGPVSGLEAVK
jgi:hypothetical protein